MANRDRQFNKMTLQFMNDLRGIPQGFKDVSEHLRSRVNMPCEGCAQMALDYLEAAEYIKRCEATAADDAMWKITAAGIRMAEKQIPTAELDPMIWG